MAAAPLDETVWATIPQYEMGLHSNSVLFYFAESMFYDRTSNNEVLFQQGLANPHLTPYLATREMFEGRLKTMSGLEFLVAQEPAETGPGAGTGVWVINKQIRRKQSPQDEITVLETYYLVGERIYMGASFADIISSRIASMSSAIDKLLPISGSAQSWSPSQGRVYQNPSTNTNTTTTTKGTTPLPPEITTTKQPTTATTTTTTAATTNLPTSRLIEEALSIHQQFGNHYMDENPITGKPGDFQLASTGRKPVNLSAAGALQAKKAALGVPNLPALNTTKLGNGSDNPLSGAAGGRPTGKETKSPKTPGGGSMQKKRRKGSKAAVTPQ
ncbi:MED6 mediator subfamily complex component-domain-containing protein [Dichotomopilus funicola]|uniref:Mediator of RNA polymerase II transcription subunit 6 n=1 Tax=Dichotomopilus funicola TaxID=1934379 RepID=A0AAN6VC19_9PEZI|nr:MED6 mediator sub complex component-domain-containing protein [Dichotomopilus funicola]